MRSVRTTSPASERDSRSRSSIEPPRLQLSMAAAMPQSGSLIGLAMPCSVSIATKRRTASVTACMPGPGDCR